MKCIRTYSPKAASHWIWLFSIWRFKLRFVKRFWTEDIIHSFNHRNSRTSSIPKQALRNPINTHNATIVLGMILSYINIEWFANFLTNPRGSIIPYPSQFQIINIMDSSKRLRITHGQISFRAISVTGSIPNRYFPAILSISINPS